MNCMWCIQDEPSTSTISVPSRNATAFVRRAIRGPTMPSHASTARRADLIDAVDLVASHADNVTRQVRFTIRKGKLGVSSTTPELGAGEQQLDADYDGEDLDIGYNAGYLLDILRSIPTEQVAFRLKTALSAGLVEPVGALPEEGEELLCLIMPLRLPDAVS